MASTEGDTGTDESTAARCEAPRWYLGTELAERLVTLRRGAWPGSTDAERARRRAERWRDQKPFSQREVWERRLASAGLTEEELHALLGESPESLRARMGAAPPWLRELESAYAAPPAEPLSWPTPEGEPGPHPFLVLAEPLIRSAQARLAGSLRELAASSSRAPFDADTLSHSLLGHLSDLLTPLLGRTLAMELHAAQLEERLTGDTPGERFQDFVRSLRRREVALELLARYPVLARQLVERLSQWEAAGLELLRHLLQDAPELWRRFHRGEEPGLLVEVRGGLSDPHRGGRGVFLLRFASGLRLVYKPRSLAVEAAFQRLLLWLDARGLTPPLRALEVLDAGDHGWMEYVEAASCASPEEVRRFYQRQGSYLALLYALDGIDIHHENLIAAGEHPFLVDLETLFHPNTRGRELRNVEHLPGAPLVGSVLRSGLLPQETWGTRERAGPDLSGLGSRPGQLTPQGFIVPVDRGTDRMRFERRPVAIPEARNRPRLGEREVPLLDYTEELVEGFSRLYRLLTEQREALLAPEGPLAAFAEAPVRVLIRNTASYGTLLLESSHPHTLGDALERQRFLDHLWRGLEERPFLEQLIPFELEELARGDVPLFTTTPGSRHLWTGSGQCLPDFFEETGLERVKRRLERLSSQDHERQLWVLRRSLDTLDLANARGGRPSYAFQEASEPVRREELLAAARRVGERLLTLSFSGPSEAHWLTLDHADSGGWRLVQTGPDLYQGVTGIALALGYLGAATGEEAFTQAARRALRNHTHQIEAHPSRVRGIGILNGWGGVIYTLTHLGALWRDSALLDAAEAHLERLPPLVETDTELDLGAGSAGCLHALLALAEQRPSERLWCVARACGERLLASAQRQGQGLGWSIPLAGNRALAGLSHGAAGIVLALLRLAAVTGDERFRQAALAGLEFERGLFSPQERNWPDLRVGATEPEGLHGGGVHFMCAWCHGAPGIGLARLAGLPFLDDGRVREEIAVAVATTLEQGFGSNHSLCHGDLGNLDFLLEAALRLRDEALRERVYRRAGGMLQGLHQHGYLYGLQSNTETPGLMVGLAGIGYGLARLAEPERLPSLLALAPPSA